MQSQATPLTEAVAEELRANMARRRVSQKWLGDLLGHSQAYISRRVTGAVPLDIAELERVAEQLGMTVSEIIIEAERRADGFDADKRRFAQPQVPVQLDLFDETIDLRDTSHIAELLTVPLMVAALAA
jgi:transcriptional regulator with XRE-family HTH domain